MIDVSGDKNPISVIILWLLFLGILVLSFFIFPIKTCITVGCVIGAWGINLFIKNAIGFSSDTSFADLSFSSFISGVTQSVNSSNSTYDIYFVLLLLIVWAINISCVGRTLKLNTGGTKPDIFSRIFIFIVSIALSLFSIAIIIFCQLQGLL